MPSKAAIRRKRQKQAPQPPALKGIVQREPSGKPRRETVADIITPALDNRVKHWGVSLDDARSSLAGYVLGVLRLQNLITRDQHEAGLKWGRLVTRYARIMGLPSASPKSPSVILIGGQDCDTDERTPDQDAKTRRDYDDAWAAVMWAPNGRHLMAALKATVIQDKSSDIGDLRCGLNVLVSLWR